MALVFIFQKHLNTRKCLGISYLGTACGPFRANDRREPPWLRPASTRTTATSGAEPAISRVLVGSRARQPRLLGVSTVGWRQRRVCPDAPHREKTSKAGHQHRQQRSPPQKEGRETLRPVVASATEPGTCLFPTGRAAASAVGFACGDGGGTGFCPTPRSRPVHGASGNGGNWSIETLLRFLLFGEAGVDALAQTRRVHFVTLITRRKQ